MIIVTGAGGFLGQHVMARLPGAVADDRTMRAQSGDTVIHLAAKCPRSADKSSMVDALADNLRIALDCFYRHRNAARFVVTGTTSAYGVRSCGGIHEGYLWDGLPAGENGPYGLAKRLQGRLLELAQGNTANLLLSNLYGPGDSFEAGRSHVVASLIRKVVDAKDDGLERIGVDGNELAAYPFLFVEDAADAVVLAATSSAIGAINVCSGTMTTLGDLSQTIASVAGWDGVVRWSRKSTCPNAFFDVSKAKRELGWAPKTALRDGVEQTMEWYLNGRSAPLHIN